MLTAAKYGILVTAIIITYLLVQPLLIFVLESLSNPEKLRMVYGPVEIINATHIKLPVTIIYNGSIVLADFQLMISGNKVWFGDITKGNHTKTIILPVEESRNISIGYEFKIAGIYMVEVNITGVNYGLK